MDTAADWVTTTLVLDGLERSDDIAWERFCRRFRGSIVRFAARYGLPMSECDDVAQETLLAFATAYRAGKYDRSKGRLRSWLFGIAHNKSLVGARRIAKEARVQRLDSDADSFWANLPDGDPADERRARRSFDSSWDETVLHACLDQVKTEVEPKTYEIFHRVVYRREEPARIAEELEVTRNAVFLAKHRVLKRLRELRVDFERPEPDADEGAATHV